MNCNCADQLQNRKPPKSRKWEKNRPKIRTFYLFCLFFSYFLYFPICLTIFWVWGVFLFCGWPTQSQYESPKKKNSFDWKRLRIAYLKVKTRLLQKSEANLSKLISGWILRGIFDRFWGAWRKKSAQKSTPNFKSEFGSLAAKIDAARFWLWLKVLRWPILGSSVWTSFWRLTAH